MSHIHQLCHHIALFSTCQLSCDLFICDRDILKPIWQVNLFISSPFLPVGYFLNWARYILNNRDAEPQVLWADQITPHHLWGIYSTSLLVNRGAGYVAWWLWWRHQLETFFRDTGPFWWESTGHRRLNKRLIKQSRRRWFETLSRHYDVIVMIISRLLLLLCQINVMSWKDCNYEYWYMVSLWEFGKTYNIYHSFIV